MSIQPEVLIRADELEAIGAESSLVRTMAAHSLRLLYKENCYLHETNTELLEAMANLIKVKGRHNTEIAYQQLITAYDSATGDVP